MSVVLRDSICDEGLRGSGMLFKGGEDRGVMKMVAGDDDGYIIHGGGHILGVANEVCRSVHGWQVNVVTVARVVEAALHLDMGHGNVAVGALERAAAVVDFDLSWWLLVGVVAKATAFLEVAALRRRCARVAGGHHGGKVGRRRGEFHGFRE